MTDNTKKYQKKVNEWVRLMKEDNSLTPRFTINAFPLKVNGDKRLVIRVGLFVPNEPIAEGCAVHNPVDDFDPMVGILLASSRAYAAHAKRLREDAYARMMDNTRLRKWAVQYDKEIREAKNIAKELRRAPDDIVKHHERLKLALKEGRVFYCPDCKGHFGITDNEVDLNEVDLNAILACPLCGAKGTVHNWHTHRWDEYPEEVEK